MKIQRHIIERHLKEKKYRRRKKMPRNIRTPNTSCENCKTIIEHLYTICPTCRCRLVIKVGKLNNNAIS